MLENAVDNDRRAFLFASPSMKLTAAASRRK